MSDKEQRPQERKLRALRLCKEYTAPDLVLYGDIRSLTMGPSKGTQIRHLLIPRAIDPS